LVTAQQQHVTYAVSEHSPLPVPARAPTVQQVHTPTHLNHQRAQCVDQERIPTPVDFLSAFHVKQDHTPIPTGVPTAQYVTLESSPMQVHHHFVTTVQLVIIQISNSRVRV
jgi:hypothetical protein